MADTWQITSTEQHTELAPTGTGFTDTRYVYYTVTSGAANGYHGKVKVPEAAYTADNVRTMVQAAVDNESEIHGLTG